MLLFFPWLCADIIIRFFVYQVKVKKIKKLTKIVKFEERNLQIFWTRSCVSLIVYINIENCKNSWLHPLSRKHILGKVIEKRSNWSSSLFRDNLINENDRFLIIYNPRNDPNMTRGSVLLITVDLNNKYKKVLSEPNSFECAIVRTQVLDRKMRGISSGENSGFATDGYISQNL